MEILNITKSNMQLKMVGEHSVQNKEIHINNDEFKRMTALLK